MSTHEKSSNFAVPKPSESTRLKRLGTTTCTLPFGIEDKIKWEPQAIKRCFRPSTPTMDRAQSWTQGRKPHSKKHMKQGGTRAAVSTISTIIANFGGITNGVPPVGGSTLHLVFP